MPGSAVFSLRQLYLRRDDVETFSFFRILCYCSAIHEDQIRLWKNSTRIRRLSLYVQSVRHTSTNDDVPIFEFLLNGGAEELCAVSNLKSPRLRDLAPLFVLFGDCEARSGMSLTTTAAEKMMMRTLGFAAPRSLSHSNLEPHFCDVEQPRRRRRNALLFTPSPVHTFVRSQRTLKNHRLVWQFGGGSGVRGG